MTINEQQRQAMLEAAKPLIKWMGENCHPHCTAMVTQTEVELVEGVASARLAARAASDASGAPEYLVD
jgi:hypothetical protein